MAQTKIISEIDFPQSFKLRYEGDETPYDCSGARVETTCNPCYHCIEIKPAIDFFDTTRLDLDLVFVIPMPSFNSVIEGARYHQMLCDLLESGELDLSQALVVEQWDYYYAQYGAEGVQWWRNEEIA